MTVCNSSFNKTIRTINVLQRNDIDNCRLHYVISLVSQPIQWIVFTGFFAVTIGVFHYGLNMVWNLIFFHLVLSTASFQHMNSYKMDFLLFLDMFTGSHFPSKIGPFTTSGMFLYHFDLSKYPPGQYEKGPMMKYESRCSNKCFSPLQTSACWSWHIMPAWQPMTRFCICLYWRFGQPKNPNHRLKSSGRRSSHSITNQSLSSPFYHSWIERLFRSELLLLKTQKSESVERERRPANSAQGLQHTAAERIAGALRKTRNDNSAKTNHNMIAAVWA